MMASKRKSSKPTRIAKEDVVVYMDEGDGLPASTDEDDTMSKIQRFIEEGSEDTPDCLQRKLEQSPASKPTNRHEDVPPEFIPKMRNSESACSSASRPASERAETREFQRDLVSSTATARDLPNAHELARRSACKRKESHDARQRRLTQNRLRQAMRRQNESEEERAIRLAQHRQRQAERRKNESEEARQFRLTQNRIRQAQRRQTESEDARLLRLSSNRLRQADRRRTESEMARAARLEQSRQRIAAHRSRKVIDFYGVPSLQNTDQLHDIHLKERLNNDTDS